jgi:hypothetical protein
MSGEVLKWAIAPFCPFCIARHKALDVFGALWFPPMKASTKSLLKKLSESYGVS